MKFCIFFCLAVAIQGATVTPMEKVIELLKDLSTKVAQEGKTDAANYDKYACFCKEQADDKLYAIEKSDAKIADLKAEIEELNTAIAELNSDISDLSKQISGLEKEIKEKTEAREKDHAKYMVKAQDMDEAIGACTAAIKALRDSKKEIKDGKVDLVQVTSGLVAASAKLAPSTKAVALLSKITAAPKFEYQSNDIIATLDDLLADFKRMKKELDQEEFDVNSAFETDRLGLQNEKQFAKQDKAEKEAIVEAKTERLQAATTDKDDEQSDRDSDQNFLDVLTSQCEEKAALFDQRSKTRADELTALSDATKKLEEGAVPNFSANKKLVGLAQKGVKLAPAFVQIVQHQQSGKDASIRKVQSFLNDLAERSGSRVLSALAVRVTVAEDHFVKVRGLISDLIAKLKADAESEAEQKGVCDKGMAAGIADRDEANARIEVANAKITTLTATKNSLEDEIDTLNKDIASLKKALLEATELRASDKAENDKTIAMSAEGAAAVEDALEILKQFYDNAFMQTGKYVPPNSDREGNTVGDLAPEYGTEKYHGSQNESKGIIGILEVLLSDFDRTNKKTIQEDKDSQEAFEAFEKDTNDSIDKKDKRIKNAEGELAEAEASILEEKQELADAKVLLESGLKKLEDLEAMCVKGEETFEERKQKRLEEIEALKQALQILEDWQA